MKPFFVLLVLVGLCGAASAQRIPPSLLTKPAVPVAAAAPAAPQEPLQLADLFPRKGFFGKQARGLAWSADDRYLAYLWNPYEDRGSDLWLYDTREGAARRLTSLEMFTAFDREAAPILERYRKDRAEDERRKSLSETERKKLDDEDERKERDRKEPQREYAGVGEFAWANHAGELLLTYRGDIFRLKMPAESAAPVSPLRLTRTQEAESGLQYARDDGGFFFRRGDNVFRMRFDSPVVEQLNPELPKQMKMGSFRLSPDETKLFIRSQRSTGTSRDVTYMTYRDRFAQARTTQRGVADDPFKSESYAYIYDLNDDPKQFPKHDGKPWQVYFHPDGEDYGQLSVDEEPWSPDSKRLVMATWKRDPREIEIVVADVDSRKLTTVYRDTHMGEHTSPGLASPFFTPDGQKIVCMLEKSGYRHAWVVDPLTAGATQVTRGDFEVYPVKMARDGKSLVVRACPENAACMGLYRVDFPDGTMHRLGQQPGAYSEPVLNHDFSRLAVSFASWKSPRELYLLDVQTPGPEKAISASHSGTFDRINRLSPQLFTYPNRHGHTIHGFMFLPPGFRKSDGRPLMIYVYGGPLGTTKQVVEGQFSSSSYLFNMYLAERMGYVTATIDPRGTSGYGGLFGSANWEAPGKAQVEDLVDGVKYFVENYGVDPKKVGVSGWSFGGFQTQMCLYTAPETFTLGIAGAGPTEWQNYNTWYTGGVIGKSHLGKPEDLDKYSLTHLAANLKAPLLLLHGMEDTNVLFQDTVKVYRELLRAGKGPLVELVVDPTGSHGLGGDIKTKDQFLIYEAFLMRHWGPHRPPTPPGG